ncbi:hypothetical protein [Psychrobacter sp. H7-1]|uniref:hypothetical protein n=1 Tax=Psychrobacter sp. H7-1 TaxID=1569265 RepID=UPI00191AF4E6|nr:hypothetical protein [Psychrobacter sp. H7-1]
MKAINTDTQTKAAAKKGLMVSTLITGVLALSATAFAAAPAQNPAAAHAVTTAQANMDMAGDELEADDQRNYDADTQADVDAAEVDDSTAEQQAAMRQMPQTTQMSQDAAGQAQDDDTAQATTVTQAQQNAAQAGGSTNMTSAWGEGEGVTAQSTAITLQQKIKDKRGELQATQPGQVEVQENRRIRAQ